MCVCVCYRVNVSVHMLFFCFFFGSGGCVCVCVCGIGDPQHLRSTSNIQAQTFLHMINLYTPVDPALLATAGSVHSFPPTA